MREKMERFIGDEDEMRAKYETCSPFLFLSARLLVVSVSGDELYEASVPVADSIFSAYKQLTGR